MGIIYNSIIRFTFELFPLGNKKKFEANGSTLQGDAPH